MLSMQNVIDSSYPGVAKDAFSEATAISQLATSWQPAAVAKPTKVINNTRLTENIPLTETRRIHAGAWFIMFPRQLLNMCCQMQ